MTQRRLSSSHVRPHVAPHAALATAVALYTCDAVAAIGFACVWWAAVVEAPWWSVVGAIGAMLVAVVAAEVIDQSNRARAVSLRGGRAS